MITLKQNLLVARKVLAQVNKKMSSKVAKTCSVEAYQNGRESGYSIVQYCNPALKVSFSENRNSDDIVVYAGEDQEFNMGGNIPSEKIYHQAKYFRYDKIDEAAQFIVDFFTQEK
jgi:hypothetical protein